MTRDSDRRDSDRRKPPNPPKPTKCQVCKDFTKQGSTGYAIRKTCFDCGHATTERRQEEPTYPDGECPHEDVDYRGSSRTTHRVYCKQCCTYNDEAPMQVFKERTTTAKKVETVQVNKVSVIESIVDEESQTLTPGQLDEILNPSLHNLSHPLLNLRPSHDLFCINRSTTFWTRTVSLLLVKRANWTLKFVQLRVTLGYASMAVRVIFLQTLSMNFESIDIEKSPHVFALLDEGCSSTCHSSAWEAEAEK